MYHIFLTHLGLDTSTEHSPAPPSGHKVLTSSLMSVSLMVSSLEVCLRDTVCLLIRSGVAGERAMWLVRGWPMGKRRPAAFVYRSYGRKA